MTKEEIYLDLSKLSEEQRKEVLRIILNKGQKIYKEDEDLLKKGDYLYNYRFLSFDDIDKEWISFTDFGFYQCLKHKMEVTYEKFKEIL